MTAQIYESLTIDEVSLVDEGASGDGGQFRPLIHLRKRKKERKPMLDFTQIPAAVRPSLKKVLKMAMDGEEAPKPTLDSILEALPSDDMRAALIAMIEELRAPAEEAPVEAAKEGEPEEEEATKAEGDEGESEEDMAKEDDEEEGTMAKSKVTLQKQVSKLTQEVAKLRRERGIQKAKDDLKEMGTPGDADALAEAMLEVEAVCSKATTKAFKSLVRGYGALAKGAATDPVGDAGSGEGAGDVAGEVAKAVAKAKAADPSLSDAQAERSVFKANPGLYQRLRDSLV